MGGWIIAGIVLAAVVIFDFIVFLGIAATSSAMDAFNHEADDLEQVQYLIDYNSTRAEKRKKKAGKRKNAEPHIADLPEKNDEKTHISGTW